MIRVILALLVLLVGGALAVGGVKLVLLGGSWAYLVLARISHERGSKRKEEAA